MSVSLYFDGASLLVEMCLVESVFLRNENAFGSKKCMSMTLL